MRRDPKIVDQYKKELLDIIEEVARDRRLLADFITDLFTPGEHVEIATRWQIVKKLAAREGYRDVASELGIGLGTVNRGARALWNKSGGFSQALRKTQSRK